MTLRDHVRSITAALDRLLGCPQERRRFRRDVGYRANLKQPRSFNEKVFWRKLHDHNPLFVEVNGKLGMRDYLRRRLGEEVEQHLVPLHQVIRHADELAVDALPDACIMKPAHSSGEIVLLPPGEPRDETRLRAICKRWLDSPPFGDRNHEWLYRWIPRRVLVEPLLSDADGKPPLDYKLFVFHGQVRLIQVDFDRFEGHRRSLYTPDWQRLDVRYAFELGPQVPPPPGLAEMIRLAGAAAAEFDFMRVDFYNVNGRVYFGELTCYPESGRGRMQPESFDFELGAWWQLDSGGQP